MMNYIYSYMGIDVILVNFQAICVQRYEVRIVHINSYVIHYKIEYISVYVQFQVFGRNYIYSYKATQKQFKVPGK